MTENLLPSAGDGQADPTSIERRILTDFVENDAGLVLELKMEVTSGSGTYSWERRLSLSDDGRALRGEESVKRMRIGTLFIAFTSRPTSGFPISRRVTPASLSVMA